jgi:hypothetical protein
MKKPFAIYTIDEIVYSEKNDKVFKQMPDKLLKVHRIFGIPILRIFAEKIEQVKIPTQST